MLNPANPQQVRSFFYHAWLKYQNKQECSAIENLACECIILHPEYQLILKDIKCIDIKYDLQNNPFLHLSMHLSIMEQISINQPIGIANIFTNLCTKHTRHEAMHIIINALQQTLANIDIQHTSMKNIEHYYLNTLQAQI